MDSRNIKFMKVSSYESDPQIESYININEIQCLSVAVSDNGDELMPAVIKFINGDEVEVDYESYVTVRKHLYGI